MKRAVIAAVLACAAVLTCAAALKNLMADHFCHVEAEITLIMQALLFVIAVGTGLCRLGRPLSSQGRRVYVTAVIASVSSFLVPCVAQLFR